MNRCIQLASQGAGFVAPNPMVGAVLVYGHRIIGEGFHRLYGEAHAEVNCFDSVASADRAFIPESTLYVSLEPCAHFGKTPPCAHRIVREGIKHVVIGTLDPFTEVNGRGVSILQEAGVKTDLGVLEKECRSQNRRFFTFHECKRPYIHLKWAQTADGFMSGKTDERLHITNPLTNRLVHKWRSEEAAIMVGTKTAAVDNPQLNNRLWWGAQPIRIVVDTRLSLSGDLKLFSDTGKTVVLNEVETRSGTRTEHSAQYIKVHGLSGHNPQLICDALYSFNIQSVLIEGGAALLNSFVRAGVWDEAHVLTNTALFAGDGLMAPEKPYGTIMESYRIGNDSIEWMINQ